MKTAYCSLLGIALCLITLSCAAQTAEDKLKAAYVYNFAKFVTWPDGSIVSLGVLTLCVMGKGGTQDAMMPIANRPAQGRTIAVQSGLTSVPAKGCEIVFIPKSEKVKLGTTLQTLSNASALTVSDIDGFSHAGGMIALITEDDRVVFEVNLDEIERAGLKINAQLLRVAKAVIAQKARK